MFKSRSRMKSPLGPALYSLRTDPVRAEISLGCGTCLKAPFLPSALALSLPFKSSSQPQVTLSVSPPKSSSVGHTLSPPPNPTAVSHSLPPSNPAARVTLFSSEIHSSRGSQLPLCRCRQLS
ncbi:hypothetical protein WN943_016417 [Citrus x changshan-huyou]